MIINDDSEGLRLAVEAYGVNRSGEPASGQRQAEIKEVARQFEALLMHTLLKSMRETTSQDGLLDNDQTRLYTSLLDQEIAQLISRRGLGLAEILERQLSKLVDTSSTAPSQVLKDTATSQVLKDTAPPQVLEDAVRSQALGQTAPWQTIMQSSPALPESWNARDSWNPVSTTGMAANLAIAEANARLSLQRSEAALPVAETSPAAQADDLDEAHNSVPQSHVRTFIDAVRPHALSAAEHTGIPAQFLIGHAALESGWGRYQIRNPDGRSSHNLFGIKADASWSGEVAEVMTTEYVGGMPVKRVEQFRSYDSYQAAFIDYADFLQSNPRYARALQATDDARAFAGELQSAGYATDPRYADKLTAVINHSLLREARWT